MEGVLTSSLDNYLGCLDLGIHNNLNKLFAKDEGKWVENLRITQRDAAKVKCESTMQNFVYREQAKLALLNNDNVVRPTLQ